MSEEKSSKTVQKENCSTAFLSAPCTVSGLPFKPLTTVAEKLAWMKVNAKTHPFGRGLSASDMFPDFLEYMELSVFESTGIHLPLREHAASKGLIAQSKANKLSDSNNSENKNSNSKKNKTRFQRVFCIFDVLI